MAISVKKRLFSHVKTNQFKKKTDKKLVSN